MVPETAVLVALIQLVDRLPDPPRPTRLARPASPDPPAPRASADLFGSADRLFLKALVIRIVKHLA